MSFSSHQCFIFSGLIQSSEDGTQHPYMMAKVICKLLYAVQVDQVEGQCIEIILNFLVPAFTPFLSENAFQ